MGLGEVGPFFEWVRRDRPAPEVRSAVRTWIAGLGVASWQAPSAQLPDLSDQLVYEVRSAEIPDTDGVCVLYVHEYADNRVDLLYVGTNELLSSS